MACEPLWIVAKPLWTVVNRCIATSSHILWIYSRGQKRKIWFLWVATVPENCRIVSDSLNCVMPDFNHWVYYQQSHSDEFRESKSTRTGIWVFPLPYYLTNTICSFLTCVGWICETTKCCSALKQPLMRGDWKRVCGKLFFTALKPPNSDLKYN